MTVWRKYNGAILPESPPHLLVETENLEKEIKKNRVFFARWASDFDCEKETKFWHIICDCKIELSDYSRNTRSKINRGLKHSEVRIIDINTVIHSGYEVYISAFNNYKTYLKLKTKEEFIRQIEDTQSGWEFWGVFFEGVLIAYSKNKIVDNYCEYASLKFNPKYLRYYSSYALLYSMNNYYMTEKNFSYVDNGARSISHNTNIQDFLIQKFKFRKAYCKLHILYTKNVKIIISVLYPFRFFLKFIKLGPFRQINILLHQQEISSKRI
jgi:hypothetical protein